MHSSSATGISFYRHTLKKIEAFANGTVAVSSPNKRSGILLSSGVSLWCLTGHPDQLPQSGNVHLNLAADALLPGGGLLGQLCAHLRQTAARHQGHR